MKDALEVLRGVVRPAVTMGFAAAVVAGFFLDKLPPDAMLAASTLSLGYWFGGRKPS